MMASSSSSSDLSSADHHLLRQQDEGLLPWPSSSSSSSLPFPHHAHGLGLGGQWSDHPALMQLEQLSSDELEALLLSAHHSQQQQQLLLAAAPALPHQLSSSLLMMQELGFQWSTCPPAAHHQDALLKEEDELPEPGGISYSDVDGAMVLPSVNVVSRLAAPGGGDAFEMSTPARLCRSLVSCGQLKQGASSSALAVHHNGGRGGNGTMPALLVRERHGGPPAAHRLQALPSTVRSYNKMAMGVVAAAAASSSLVSEDNGSCDKEHQMQAATSKTKKPRIDSTTTLVPSFKVRKEKLGDRIAALQQLVSPFGKTDTASVLMEAIGYIKFLQDQVETLSGPYMQRSSGNKKAMTTVLHQRGPSWNDMGDDESKQQQQGGAGRVAVDLGSRGLCLVPLSCTSFVTNENAVWPPPPNFRRN